MILTLKEGVRISHISLPFVEISQFYIKLDKKLIVSINDINVNKNENPQTSYDGIISYLDNIPLLNLFFESISIQKLHYLDNTVRLLFKEDMFYFDSKYFSLDSKVQRYENNIYLHISELVIKDADAILKGIAKINLFTKHYDFKGSYEVQNLQGNINLHVNKSLLEYQIDMQKTSSIDNFMDFLNTKVKLEPEVSNWIYKYIRAADYQINYLKGKFDFNTYNYFPQQMSAQAIVHDASIKFHPNVPVAQAKTITINLENNTLNFTVNKATYETQIIEEPKVSIYNLLTEDTGILIDINSTALLNTNIQKILQAYKIHIPLIQQEGNNHSHLMLNVDFVPAVIKEYSGEFDFNNTSAKLSGLDIFSKHGKIMMNNENLDFQDVNMRYQDLFDISFSGILNTKTKHFDGTALINSLNLDLKGTKLLHVKKTPTKVTFDFDENETVINILNLHTELVFKKSGANFMLKDIRTLQPYSEVLQQLSFNNAKGIVKTDDYRNFSADINVQNFDIPLFDKNSSKIRDFNLSLQTDGNTLNIQDKLQHFNVVYKNDLEIALKDYDIHTNFSSSTNNMPKNITFYSLNSNILDTNSSKKILSNSLKLSIDGNKTSLTTLYKKKKLLFRKDINSIYMQGNKLDYEFINGILGTHALTNGEMTFFISGKNEKNFDGTLFLEQSTIKDLKFFNNLMAFINTIPSLISLKSPKFNENGYEVQNGYFIFMKRGDVITFKEIKLKGYSADISGKGNINLKTNQINMDLQISTLKDISNLINKIPLIKDIVLGEGGRIYTNITVEGTLDDPDIKTHILEDTIFTPVNIIKRTLQLPFK